IADRMCVKGCFCAILFRTARKSLILNGEMSEWSIEHAWKSKLASRTPTRANAHAIRGLRLRNYRLLCVRKPRRSSGFRASRITVLSQSPCSFARYVYVRFRGDLASRSSRQRAQHPRLCSDARRPAAELTEMPLQTTVTNG